MPVPKKKTIRKVLKKRASTTVIVTEKNISSKDTLFPEKVAEAKKILKNCRWDDSLFRS